MLEIRVGAHRRSNGQYHVWVDGPRHVQEWARNICNEPQGSIAAQPLYHAVEDTADLLRARYPHADVQIANLP